MRIFEVLLSTANSSIKGNRTWYRNLYEPLVDLGDEVYLFSAEEGYLAMQRRSKSARDRFSQRLFDTFSREHAKKSIDLFFAYLLDGMIEPELINEINKIGVPTCNFSCNNTHQFYLVDEISPYFDFNLHSERDAKEKFLAIGANPVWWPMASNPNYFKPQNVPRTVDVSFVGANYSLRSRYIKYLLDSGIDVHAYGPHWRGGAKSKWRSFVKRYLYLLKSAIATSVNGQTRASALLSEHDFRRNLMASFPNNVHLPLSDKELIEMYSRSHISLGFLEVYDDHDPSKMLTQHLHLREFEAPMSGALYCTGYSSELAEMFEPDKEVLVYANQFELLEKVRYYLAHPKESEEIRKSGYERALQDHTYHKRFRSLFNQIGLRS
jgi:spore maturation protein CgeB